MRIACEGHVVDHCTKSAWRRRASSASRCLRGLLTVVAYHAALGCCDPAVAQQHDDLSFLRLPAQQCMTLGHSPITPQELEKLLSLREGSEELRWLALYNCSQLSRIPDHESLPKSLQFIHISGTPVGDSVIAFLNSCTQIEWVMLSRCNVTSNGVLSLTLPETTRFLSFSGAPIDDQVGYALSRALPSNLNGIAVCHCDMSDYGAIALLSGSNVDTLYLDGTMVTDGACESFARAEQLTSLSVEESLIGNAGVMKLAESSTIHSLGISGIALTRDAIARLSAMKSLRLLKVAECGLSPLSVQVLLSGGSRINSLWIGRGELPAQQLERLRTQFPGVTFNEY